MQGWRAHWNGANRSRHVFSDCTHPLLPWPLPLPNQSEVIRSNLEFEDGFHWRAAATARKQPGFLILILLPISAALSVLLFKPSPPCRFLAHSCRALPAPAASCRGVSIQGVWLAVHTDRERNVMVGCCRPRPCGATQRPGVGVCCVVRRFFGHFCQGSDAGPRQTVRPRSNVAAFSMTSIPLP